MKKTPLVSICTPNYNHAHFMEQCIESVLAQTYPNIEYSILDNQSADDSVDIARKYAKSGVNVCRNTLNVMNASYGILLGNLSSRTSEYMMLLPADDYIEPTFVEECVKVMEEHHNVGYVHAERDFVTDDGELIELDPFYDRSFIVGGENVMPIYMMTTVAHPAQALYRRNAFNKSGGYGMPVDHFNVDKALWFYMSAVSDYAYIRKKLSRVRIGMQTETTITQKNFQHPILAYMTLLEFIDHAERNGFSAVLERKDKALLKLSGEFLSHVAAAMLDNEPLLAKRYLTFCKLISRDIESDKAYAEMEAMLLSGSFDREKLKSFCTLETVRKRGYLPPDGYKEIDLKTGGEQA